MSKLIVSVSAGYILVHRIGPEKGVIHIALGAVNNALWDMYARSRKKPLWKLIVDMTPVCTLPRTLSFFFDPQLSQFRKSL